MVTKEKIKESIKSFTAQSEALKKQMLVHKNKEKVMLEDLEMLEKGIVAFKNMLGAMEAGRTDKETLKAAVKLLYSTRLENGGYVMDTAGCEMYIRRIVIGEGVEIKEMHEVYGL